MHCLPLAITVVHISVMIKCETKQRKHRNNMSLKKDDGAAAYCIWQILQIWQLDRLIELEAWMYQQHHLESLKLVANLLCNATKWWANLNIITTAICGAYYSVNLLVIQALLVDITPRYTATTTFRSGYIVLERHTLKSTRTIPELKESSWQINAVF